MTTGEAIKIKQHQESGSQQLRVTMAEIAVVKRAFIERNMLLTLEEAGAIFGKSDRWAQERVADGSFIAADEYARKGKNGSLQASKGIRVTIESVEEYRASIIIPAENWGK